MRMWMWTFCSGGDILYDREVLVLYGGNPINWSTCSVFSIFSLAFLYMRNFSGFVLICTWVR